MSRRPPRRQGHGSAAGGSRAPVGPGNAGILPASGSRPGLPGWNDLRHGGLLLDAQRQGEIAAHSTPESPGSWLQSDLRRRAELMRGHGPSSTSERSEFIAFVLERLCGFEPGCGSWLRGNRVPAEWSRRALTGESVRPRQLWLGPRGAVLPVFASSDKQVGIGRGRRETSRVLGWLRAGNERLALVTNGRQWRLLFAGLDFDAWCEWDIDLWSPTARRRRP